MPVEFVIRVSAQGSSVDVPATLVAAGPEAARAFRDAAPTAAVGRLLLTGDRDYYAVIAPSASAQHGGLLTAAKGAYVRLAFARRSPVRRVLAELALPAARPASSPPSVAVDLTEGVAGRAPLWLLADGTFSTRADAAQQGLDARPALVAAARWISSRRGTSFERLFVPSAFFPDRAARLERVSEPQARAMLSQAREALRAAAPRAASAGRPAA